MESFGPGALQPFRLLVPPGGRVGNLYAYSSADPAVLRETAGAAALPETIAVLDPSRIETKPMPGEWREGQRLGFDIRLRPVLRLKHALGAFGVGAECDVFLAKALRDHADTPEGMAQGGESREDVYTSWLAERFGEAAEPETSRLVRFQRSRAVRRGRVIEGPDAVIQGDLMIRDPAVFATLLMRGAGRHRAYGYGMLLLRPAGRPAPSC